MRRFKTLGLALTAVVVVAAMGAAYASAAMTLPNFTTNTTFTGTSAVGTLTSAGFTIKCEKSTIAGTMEATNRLGLFTIDFQECSTSLTTEPCHGLGGSPANLILASGSWHLVLRTVSATDQRLFLFLLNPLHIECGTVLLSVRGNVLGSITAGGTEKEFSLIVKSTGAAQEITSFEDDTGNPVETKLEAAANLGFHVAGESSASNVILTKENTKLAN